MEYGPVIYSKKDGVATITLNRPEQRNAFNPELVAGFESALADAANDDAVRVLVITGAGQAFCSGGDVKAMAQRFTAPGGLGGRDATTEGVPLYAQVHHFPKPTIAAVNGVAVGGGMEIALACDIRIASDRARFSEAFVRRGMMPTGGGTYVLPRLIGIDKACMLIMTGDMVDAREAERIGLVTRTVPHEELEATVAELAEKLAKAAPLAVRAAKQAIYRGLGTDLDAALYWAAQREAELTATEDHEEGTRAFTEKREPVFRGK